MSSRTALVLAALLISANSWPASASCVMAIGIRTANNVYVTTPGCEDLDCGASGSSVTDNVLGDFWVLDFGNPEVGLGIDSGSFPALGGILYVYPGYPAWIITTWAADPGRMDLPCPGFTDPPHCMAVDLSDVGPGTSETVFLLMTVPPDESWTYVFDTDGDFLLSPLAPPEIVAVSRTASSVSVTLQGPSEDDLAPGLYLHPECFELDDGTPTPPVRGYRIYFRDAPFNASLPSERRTVEWTPWSETIPLGTPVALDVPCDGGQDRFLALALVYDSDFVSGHVSAPVRIECRPRRQLFLRKPSPS